MYRHQSVCGCVQQHLCVGVSRFFLSLLISLSIFFFLSLLLSFYLSLSLSTYLFLSLSLYSSSLYRYVIGMYRHQSVCGCVQQHLCVGVRRFFLSLLISLSIYFFLSLLLSFYFSLSISLSLSLSIPLLSIGM